MLKTIYIKNFALAYNLNIEFYEGLNILTGETGAGKSIIVGAISAVLGGRVFTEIVRSGEEKAIIEAVFDISHSEDMKTILKDKGLENGTELILRREISAKGTTRAFINDIGVTVTTLSEIGDHLVDIHSQHEHQSILKKEIHRYFLDAYGKLNAELDDVAEKYKTFRIIESKLNELQQKKDDLNQKYDLYKFQVDEIDKAHLSLGEEEKLQSERKILVNTEKIFSYSKEFVNLLNSNDQNNLNSLMGQAVHVLKELSEYSQNLKNISIEFSSAKIVVEEAGRSIEEFQNGLEFDPERLEEIEQRLSLINQLKKKYGATIEEILNFKEKVFNELQLQENFDFELGKLQKEYTIALNRYVNTAQELSNKRKKVAKKLETAVIKHLKNIGMSKIRYQVAIELLEHPQGIYLKDGTKFFGDEYGIDQIEFFISPNPGEDFKPLIKIASGGEVSRIMLALKNILAEADQIPLLIFDEIDAGVSGQIAFAVGQSIQKLANTHQILCVTHLPQIAVFGKSHYRVMKYIEEGRTFIKVTFLNEENRIEEIANLMSGNKVSQKIIESAKQLLNEAKTIEISV
jgi:DNA repair protein RecN (Recombination protein N)